MTDIKSKITTHTVVIDNSVFELLLEEGVGFEMFMSKLLINKVIKRKFLLMVALNNKITRLSEIEGTLQKLITKIDSEMDDMSTEDAMKYFQILSDVYSNDVSQLEVLFSNLIKSLTK